MLSRIKNGIWLPDLASIDSILTHYFQIRRSGYFIQIGSNDGIHNDPLFTFISRNDWHGIMIEPFSEAFASLKKNMEPYSSRIKTIKFAIGNENSVQDFYFIPWDRTDQFPKWVRQVGSLDVTMIRRLKEKFPGIDDLIQKEKVNVITFNQLLSKYEISKLELLHLDAEGYDGQILLSIDFKQIHPEIILFEHVHLLTNEYKKVLRFLRRSGYECFYWNMDTLAISLNLDIRKNILTDFKLF